LPSSRQKIVAAVTRRYPFYSGCERLANHPIMERLVGRDPEVAWGKVRGGYSVAAPLADEVGRSIYYFGDLDKKVTWVCTRLVQPNDVVLDIGANLGLLSFVMARLVGRGGIVHSFEPNPTMVDLINQAIELNGVKNVILHPFALGASPGELKLSIPALNAGAASLVPARWSDDGSTAANVQVRTLSEVIAERKIPHIRLIKMDVEGFEPEVIRGAVDAFSNDPPDAILFELNDSVPHAEHQTIQALDELGYSYFGLPRKLIRMQARELDLRKENQLGHNYIAARRGEIYDSIARRLGAR
jgi:FkbM family methyltransferase